MGKLSNDLILCQREIRRLRCVVRTYEAQMRELESYIWTYYGDGSSERILAYAVEVTGLEDGKVTGDLYPLDYREHVELVTRMSVPADWVRVVHEKGAYFQDGDKHIHKGKHKLFGKFLYSEYVPNDSGALETVLRQEEWKRMNMRCGKVENHIRNIRKSAA
mgnify:CR=1 FL=1